MLIALAMLLAPAITRVGEALAAVPDHHGQMMTSGHCKILPAPVDTGSSDHDKSAGKNCCISMCMAVAVEPVPPIADKIAQRTPPVFLTPTFHRLSPAELATPPPRFS